MTPSDAVGELRPRFYAVAAAAILGLLGLWLRLFQIQVLEGEHYARRAERNFIDTVDVEAPRGHIFDREGRPVASNRPAYTLYVTARPRVPVEDTDTGRITMERVAITRDAILRLASHIEFADDADREGLVADLEALRDDETRGKKAVAVRRNLSWDEFAKITTRPDELAPWVEIRESTRRYYPQGEVTAFVSGYVGQISAEQLERTRHLGYRMGDRVGLTGVERQWENYLRGRLGRRARVVDNRRREVENPPQGALAALPPDRDPIPGQDIYLTIDLDLQAAAWEALSQVVAGGVIAVDVHTGEILALASSPAVDPNRRQQPISRADYQAWATSPLKPFVDRTIQEHYFPGSTYKVVSALAALEEPTFDPTRTVECGGFVDYGGRRFRDTHRHGEVDLEQAIVQSCNVYFYNLAIEHNLSLARMERWARMLGLGERTGIGLNVEAPGRIPTEASEMREGTYQRGVRLNSAIGQGNVKATVLQMAMVYAAIANGGRVLTPYIVDRVVTSDGKLVFQAERGARNDAPVIPADARELLHRGLVGVVNSEQGTAYKQRPRNLLVAGKTGTAQVGRERVELDGPIKGWDPSKDHAWFAGYAPAEDPRIAIVAFVEHGGTGADAAAPIVMKMALAHLQNLELGQGGGRVRAPGVPPPLPGAAKDKSGGGNGRR